MTSFFAVDGSTIWDVCLNTYGTLNLLGKLMDDNNYPGVETYPKAGQEFLFDETLVSNQQTFKRTALSGEKYATKRIIAPALPDNGEFHIHTFADANQETAWTFTFDGDFDLRVDWGDGNIEEFTGTGPITITHDYTDRSDWDALVSSTVISKLVGIDLGLGKCQIIAVEGLETCKGLVNLRLANNYFASFNPAQPLPATLAVLDLSSNALTSFDPAYDLPAGLTELYLNLNQLTAFDMTTPLPAALLILHLADNNLTAFNPFIILPSGLTQLILGTNLITSFDPSHALPDTLEVLYLQNNKLTTWDPGRPYPSALQALYLNSNQIVHFNPSISNFPAGLTVLNLQGNLLEDFAPSVTMPTAFAVFSVDGNVIDVPEMNTILMDLDGLGYSAGIFNLNNQTPPAPPSGAGAISKGNLISRGCTVITD